MGARVAGGLAAAERKLPLQWVVLLVPLVAGCVLLGGAAAVAVELRCVPLRHTSLADPYTMGGAMQMSHSRQMSSLKSPS